MLLCSSVPTLWGNLQMHVPGSIEWTMPWSSRVGWAWVKTGMYKITDFYSFIHQPATIHVASWIYHSTRAFMIQMRISAQHWEVWHESDWRNNKHKTHTQAEWGSMTEQRDPHKISVKDTNKSWLWLWVCNLFDFQQCKGFISPPRSSFIVVRSYSQLILRFGRS